jgi:hypothetical protein
MEELKDRFGWEWYGGHHLDNRFTAFYHRYFMVRRFGVDGRFLGHSGLVRSGQMARQDAIDDLAHEPHCDPHLIALVKKRLGFDDAAFESIMTAPRRSWREYPTYKRTFERLRPLFWLMYKFDLVPKSFYMKFCVNK